jgi:hypothetical protein
MVGQARGGYEAQAAPRRQASGRAVWQRGRCEQRAVATAARVERGVSSE